MIVPALERGGYQHRTQTIIGTRCGGGTHKVDAVAVKGDDEIIVSMKWQQTGGTAEQKVPFEVMCLADAVRSRQAKRAYIGTRRRWLEPARLLHVRGFAEHLIHSEHVKVVTLEAFIRLANNGQL